MSEVIFKGAAADELSSKIRISAVLENTVAFDNVRMAQCVESLFFGFEKVLSDFIFISLVMWNDFDCELNLREWGFAK
jgi:hypothetical protein